jgi:hypothetical protein
VNRNLLPSPLDKSRSLYRTDLGLRHEGLDAGLWKEATRAHPQGHDFDRLTQVGIGEALKVDGVKLRDGSGQGRFIEDAGRQVNSQFITLAAVAHIERQQKTTLIARDSIVIEKGLAFLLQLPEKGRKVGKRLHAGGFEDAASKVVDDIGPEHPVGRKRACGAWEDHAVDADLCGNCRGMQPSGAAERYDREILRVQSAFEQAEPNCGRHVRHRNCYDAFGRVL